jgi:hypothetical protein
MASSDGRRLALVIGGGLAVGLGLAAIYFLVVSPRQQRSSTREQIAVWDDHWQTAQRCLFGSTRRGTDLAEAIALAAFDDERPDSGECNQRIGKLSRPEGPATTLDDVEDAWRDVETHAIAVARRYGAFVSAPMRERAGLGVAVGELDVSYARLRAAAGLPVAAVKTDGSAIASLTPARLGPDGKVEALAYARVVGELVQARFATEAATYDVVARGPADVTARPIPRTGVRSWPDGSWGAALVEEGGGVAIRAGGVGADGTVSGGALVARGSDAEIELVAALGDGDERVVVGGDSRTVRVFRSRDRGRTWTALQIKEAVGARTDPAPAAAAVDIFWAGERGWRWSHVTAAAATALPAMTTLEVAPDRTCPAGAARWSITTSPAQVVRVGGDAIAVAADGATAVLACRADAALVATADGFLRCAATGCAPALADVPAGIRGEAAGQRTVAALDEARTLLAAQRADLIAIWGLAATPRFVRIPDSSALVGLVVWGGAAHAVLWGDPGLTVAAIP